MGVVGSRLREAVLCRRGEVVLRGAAQPLVIRHGDGEVVQPRWGPVGGPGGTTTSTAKK